MNHRNRFRLLIVLATVVASLVGACASAPPVPNANSLDELYQAAKAEGQVVWYAPKPDGQMAGAIKAFEKKYPGIKVKYVNKKAPDLVTQLNVEQAARRVSFDVSNAGGLTVLPSLDMAAKVDWAKYKVPQEQIFAGNFVYIWAVPKVWSYNTNAVPPDSVPNSWNAMLDSRWNAGKLTVESRGSFMTVWAQDPTLGTDAGKRYAASLAALHPHFTDNTTQAHSNIVSGQTPVGTDLINLVLKDQEKKAPVAIAPIGPTNANKAYLFVPEGAPHPAAGRLLTAFLASREGQAALAKNYNSVIPNNTDCTDAEKNRVVGALCAAGVQWHGETDVQQYQKFAAFFPEIEKAMGTNVD